MARSVPRTREKNGEKQRRRASTREPKPAPQKTKAGAGRALASKLAAELDTLRELLLAERARVAELETRVDEDPLTGLLNRRGFMKALERTLAYARRYKATGALLFLDLDGFKAVNDKHGHAAGDWVLGRVGRLIVGAVRASDVVARVGGDEFVVLLWNLNEAQAIAKARALEALSSDSPFEQKRGKNYTLGLSAGFTMLIDGDTSEAVLARADEAMYARKRERKMRGA
ncbi:MAG TPA: GGDEF domain-containing protein [Xanthobacteraceae bacterium]|nr:GGDEF domain-containing protein [Xanthobacteraceae bacterium]